MGVSAVDDDISAFFSSAISFGILGLISTAYCKSAVTPLPWSYCSLVLSYQFYNQFYHNISYVMEIWFCSCKNSFEVITPEFCMWHGNCVVMACAQFCRNTITRNGITINWAKYLFTYTWNHSGRLSRIMCEIGSYWTMCFSWCVHIYHNIIYQINPSIIWKINN